MKNNDDIHTTDTNEIKQLINRVKQGELDQGDALLIEKLLSILLTIVSLLQRKHTSIQRMKRWDLAATIEATARNRQSLACRSDTKLRSQFRDDSHCGFSWFCCK